MPYPHKKHMVLSQAMEALKIRIKDAEEQQKPFLDTVHKRSKLAQYLVEALQKGFGLLTPILQAAEELRITGFAFQMFAVIPNAITTLTDKKSSIANKILASFILLGTTALGITAFVLGGIVAAGIGVAVSALATLIEGVSFIGSLISRSQTNKAYNEKKLFMELIKNRDFDTLKEEKYRERLVIRALELQHLIEKQSILSHAHAEEELDFILHICDPQKYVPSEKVNGIQKFINFIRNTMGLHLIPPEEDKVTKLLQLYQDRQLLIIYLAQMIKIFQQKEDDTISKFFFIGVISAIQQDIAELDKEVETLTEPLHELERNHIIAKEAIAKSTVNLALGAGALTLSVVGLVILLGTLAAPPILGPVLIGFGVGLAVFGVIKWGLELYFKRQDEKIMKEREKENKLIILEESLKFYDEHPSCSYSAALRPILNSPKITSIDPQASMKEIEMVNLEHSASETSPTIETSQFQNESKGF
ncbi:SidA protein, subsrate of the Dot/Icm transport system [Legionella wadsworthii]|uniref:SidA protein, subsrate of the Dot/Icm transport system n=1 Tax=Legionella wadsworthii TaxID=28088 RepID=A0A378LZQ3_9GAMM|nr:T4SS effector SidA family protein [Legionella wadsworthii]STY29541.1 SidA protein, subsrate of the Dot/Icm transport system [Legionella wadsworthii]